nr:MAG TPA: hypothetical protein [Caudoviricetes sp.]
MISFLFNYCLITFLLYVKYNENQQKNNYYYLLYI